MSATVISSNGRSSSRSRVACTNRSMVAWLRAWLGGRTRGASIMARSPATATGAPAAPSTWPNVSPAMVPPRSTGEGLLGRSGAGGASRPIPHLGPPPVSIAVATVAAAAAAAAVAIAVAVAIAERPGPEVARLEQVGPTGERRRRSLQHQIAVAQHVAPVGQPQRQVDVLLDQHDAGAGVVADAPEDGQEAFDDDRGQPQAHLVHQQQLRPTGQGPAE